MEPKICFIFGVFLCTSCWAWEQLPQIPTGHRAQYLVLHKNGGYKYGYDTGDGNNAAKQSADNANQVEGHYFYKSPNGQHFDLKYTSGIQGFVPEGYEKLFSTGLRSYAPVGSHYPAPKVYQDSQAGTGDASYAFGFDTDSYKRQETSDARGNIKGSYSYKDQAGIHDLSYVAGESTGFVATSGSLAQPNGLIGSNVPSLTSLPATTPSSSNVGVSYSLGYAFPSTPSAPNTNTGLPTTFETNTNTEDDLANTGDASYNFVIDTDEYKRTETSDANGNVRGSFSYKNAAGTQDLSYAAGRGTGFVATGGSLSNPNEISKSVAAELEARQEEQSSGDASYSFGFDTGEYRRQESSDAAGNVQGNYAYKNQVGSHDLSYVAGSGTGFQSTGGSLSVPPGVNEAQLRHGEELAKSGQVAVSRIQITPSIVGNSVHGSGYSFGKGLSGYLPPNVPHNDCNCNDVQVTPSTGTYKSTSLGNGAIVRTYLPPFNEKGKFGYIYESQF